MHSVCFARLRSLVPIVLALLGACAPQQRAVAPPAPSAPTTTTVYLVRHAEREAGNDADPALSPAGRIRAEELKALLSAKPVAAIFTTQFARTQQTAEPLADARGVRPIVVYAGGAEHAPRIAATILDSYAGKSVLVVGHSNTVPDIIAALGVAERVSICESEYDLLFEVVLVGTRPTLTSTRYGAPAAVSCSA